MLTTDSSPSLAENRNDHLCNIQIIQADCHRHNIHNRVHCSHLMKMHLIYRNIVCFTLCLCKNFKYTQCDLLCILSHCTMLYNIGNFFYSTVFVMVMVLRCSCAMGVIALMAFMMMSMQIFHIMVMIFMLFIQHNIKITCIYSGLYNSADLCLKS